MTVRQVHAAAVFGALVVGVTLWAWGQPLISASGTVRFWVGSVWSSENSQQIADWYTLSHFIHGMLVATLGRLILSRPSYPILLSVALVTGVAWEIVEHTEWVLSSFRESTLYQGYVGDTVLNAVSDYLWMLGGFLLAHSIRIGYAVVLMVGLELLSASVARDSLILTTLSLVHPVEAVAEWQQAIRPD